MDSCTLLRTVQSFAVATLVLVVLGPSPAEAQIAIYPGTDIQSVVNASPPGSYYILKSGTHRLQTIRPKNGDMYQGESGTVLSGSRVLTNFTRSGNTWVVGGQTQQGAQQGVCNSGFPRCAYPEDLFVDHQVMRHVGSLGEVGPGRWFFDYPGDRIYMGDDPTGHLVEASVTPNAFVSVDSRVSGVRITGLVIEKYASAGNTGAISAPNAYQWIIWNNDIRLNHSAGVTVGEASQVLYNHIHRNGQVGIGASNSRYVLIESNDVSYNGQFFFQYWGAGGVKMVAMADTVLRGNNAHHNFAGGLWCDGDCYNIIFENNLVDDNEQFGIHYEISFNAIIRNNTVRRNGLAAREGPGQSGIYVFAAKNVEIYNNLLDGNGWGIMAWQEARGWSSRYGQSYEVENLYVHDNWLIMTRGINGLAQTIGDTSYYTSRNNRWVRNWYWMAPGVDFYWMDQHMMEQQWHAYGQDPGGTFWR